MAAEQGPDQVPPVLLVRRDAVGPLPVPQAPRAHGVGGEGDSGPGREPTPSPGFHQGGSEPNPGPGREGVEPSLQNSNHVAELLQEVSTLLNESDSNRGLLGRLRANELSAQDVQKLTGEA